MARRVVATAEIQVKGDISGVAGDLEKVEGSLREVERQARDTGSTMDREMSGAAKNTSGHFNTVGSSIKGALVGVAAGFGAAALVSGVRSTIDAASDLNESINAINVTFGESADGVLALGENAAKSVGLSNSEFNGLAVQFSSFASTIAGEGGNVTGTLDDMTVRMADFASVMNLDVAEAGAMFQSGLAGQSEPLRKYGIDLSDATIQAYAYANGIGETGTALTEQQKVQARYGSLMEQTSKTQGDFANTSGEMANAQRIASAEIANASAKIGSAFLPVLATLAPVLADVVGQLADQLAPVLPQVAELIGTLATAALELLPPLLDIAMSILPPLIDGLTLILPVIVEVVNWITNLIASMPPPLLAAIAAGLAALWLIGFGPVGWVVAAIIGLVIIIQQNFDLIQSIIGGVIDWIAENWPLLIAIITGPIGVIVLLIIRNWETIREFIFTVIGVITNFLRSAWETIRNAASTAWNAIKTAISNVLDAIRNVISNVWNGIKTTISNILDGIRSVISSVWNGIKSTVSTIIEGIKTTISNIWNGIKTSISNILDAIKAVIVGVWNTVKTTATEKWQAIKTAITDKVQDAKDKVGDIIDGIVGFFTDLPGRILSGLGNIASQIADKLTPDLPGPIGSIVGKLFAQGGIVNRPTIGVVGEAGPEAIIPLRNPGRAMQLMQEAGLDRLAAGGGAPSASVNIANATFQDATDADLVAQRTVLAMGALLVAS